MNGGKTTKKWHRFLACLAAIGSSACADEPHVSVAYVPLTPECMAEAKTKKTDLLNQYASHSPELGLEVSIHEFSRKHPATMAVKGLIIARAHLDSADEVAARVSVLALDCIPNYAVPVDPTSERDLDNFTRFLRSLDRHPPTSPFGTYDIAANERRFDYKDTELRWIDADENGFGAE